MIFKVLMIFIISLSSHAEIMLGSGMSSVTKGRTVPNLYTGYDAGAYVVSAYGVGVKTEVYYHSAYRISYYEQATFGGNKRIGFGLGAHYSVRGFKNGKVAEEEKETDFSIGPGFRFAYEFGDIFFATLETMYGINGLMFAALSFQNVNSLNLGVRF